MHARSHDRIVAASPISLGGKSIIRSGSKFVGCEHIDPATESYVAKMKEAHFVFVHCQKGASKKGGMAFRDTQSFRSPEGALELQ